MLLKFPPMSFKGWLRGDDLIEHREHVRTAAVTEDNFVSAGGIGELALRIPTVYRCTELISHDVSAMPVKVWNTLRDEPVDDVPRVLRRPDPFTTRAEFMRATIVDLLTFGDAIWETAARGDDGFATALRRIPTQLVNINWDHRRGNTTAQIVGARSYRVAGRVVDPREIHHIRLLDFPGHPDGLGVFEALTLTIDGALAAESMVRSTFQDGVFPSGVVEHPANLSKTGAERLKGQFVEAHGGNREPVVMTGGATFNSVSTSMRDQEWIGARQLSAVDIARGFGVPASMMSIPLLGGSSGLNYSNDQSQRVSLLHTGLAPIMTRLETALSLAVLPSTKAAYFDATRFLAGLPAGGAEPEVIPAQPTDPRNTRVDVAPQDVTDPQRETAPDVSV